MMRCRMAGRVAVTLMRCRMAGADRRRVDALPHVVRTAQLSKAGDPRLDAPYLLLRSCGAPAGNVPIRSGAA
ncbi:hypothetical protein [Paenibacillus piri]|uniref:Uncharacterized protein n=1 Tax=Paenibacillus piri TaxID=2547395 RepID=A0A4R5KXG2_9BACL|nr:hypothetical protein [Paenibacillus piri]TDG00517.1 hypothetical protein E1757_02470 [Paenibacillus piri]